MSIPDIATTGTTTAAAGIIAWSGRTGIATTIDPGTIVTTTMALVSGCDNLVMHS